MRSVTVVRANPQDWEVARDLRLSALADAPDAFYATLADEDGRDDAFWQDRLRGRRSDTFLARLRDGGGEAAPVGVAVLGDHYERAGELALYALWVARHVRGLGVGDALVEAVIARALERGATELTLEVGDANAAAIRLYGRWGFVPTGHRAAFPPPRAHITEHERRLDLRRYRPEA